jgi:hypothetical protein
MNDRTNRAREELHRFPVGTAAVNVDVLEQQIDHERIARRAYAIFESRHRAEGRADEDWFQAESEYAARGQSEPDGFEHDGASNSFAERIRPAQR